MSLLNNGFSDLQPDGELLLTLRLEERATWDNLLEEIAESSDMLVTDSVRTVIEDMLMDLTDKASCGQLSTTYSVIQLELLRAARRTRTSLPPVPDFEKLVKRWRHWKPGASGPMEAVSQRSLENSIRDKWLLRMVSIFIPHKERVPKMKAVAHFPDPIKEYVQLFGKSRFSTIRGHCLMIERILKTYSSHGAQSTTFIPWTENSIRVFINQTSDAGWSPNALDRSWRTISYLSKALGLLNPDSHSSLKAKMEAVCELMTTPSGSVTKQAVVPTIQLVRALEVATTKGSSALRYCAAHARFLLGCSARWNDGQHVLPHTVHLLKDTLEAMAWQTKSTSARQAVKKPVPLIAPLHTFSGVQWWIPLVQGIKFLMQSPPFADMDYLLPRLNRDLDGFIPRPATYSTSLSTIRKLLAGNVQASDLASFTWHSLRVFMPHWAFVNGIEAHKRQYLGRWNNESTADVYVRSHRTMVCDIWKQVTDGSPAPPSTLVNEDNGEPVVITQVIDAEDDQYEMVNGAPSPAKSQSSLQATTAQGASGPTAPVPADLVPPPLGPLTVAIGKRKTGCPPTFKIHLMSTSQTSVGCGWAPDSKNMLILDETDLQEDMSKCARCFVKYDFPSTWGVNTSKTHQNELSDMSSASDTASSNDTDTDAEQLPSHDQL